MLHIVTFQNSKGEFAMKRAAPLRVCKKSKKPTQQRSRRDGRAALPPEIDFTCGASTDHRVKHDEICKTPATTELHDFFNDQILVNLHPSFVNFAVPGGLSTGLSTVFVDS